jgi:hypothetical protein
MTRYMLVATFSTFLEKQQIIEKRKKFNLEPDVVGINYGNVNFKDMRIYQTKTNSKIFNCYSDLIYIYIK